MTLRGKDAVMAEAVRAGADEAAERRRPDEQLELLQPRTRFSGARARAIRATVEREGRVGRPPGAANLATEEWRKFLFSKGVSPLVAMARYAMMPPDLLAQELGCSKLEAFDRWQRLQEALAPYLHQQMPRAVDVQGATAGILILGDLTVQQRERIASDLGVEALTLSAEQYQEKQDVSAVEADPSQGNGRTEDAK